MQAAVVADQQGDWDEALRLARIVIAKKPVDLAYRIATDAGCHIPDQAAVTKYGALLSDRSYDDFLRFCGSLAKMPERATPAVTAANATATVGAALARKRCMEARQLLAKSGSADANLRKQIDDCESTRQRMMSKAQDDPQAEAYMLAWYDELSTVPGEDPKVLASMRDSFYYARAIKACGAHDQLRAHQAFGQLRIESAKTRTREACTKFGVDVDN